MVRVRKEHGPNMTSLYTTTVVAVWKPKHVQARLTSAGTDCSDYPTTWEHIWAKWEPAAALVWRIYAREVIAPHLTALNTVAIIGIRKAEYV
jgi:hypothetical protein